MTKIDTAEVARKTVLEAIDLSGRDLVLEAVAQWNNTTENDIDDKGDIWVANPQTGHWLNDDHLVEFANFLAN